MDKPTVNQLDQEEAAFVSQPDSIIHSHAVKKLAEYDEQQGEEVHPPLQEMLVLLMIHEIRTILTLVLCNTQLIQQSLKKEFLHLSPGGQAMFGRELALLSSVVEHTDHINALLTTLVDATRLCGERPLPTIQERVDIAVLLHQSIQQQTTKDHELQLQIDDTVQSGLGDRARIAQVMGTLITNAINSSSPGMPILITVVQEEAAQKIIVTVHNEGDSIPEEEQADLFNFTSCIIRCLNASKKSPALELPIAYALVMQQGGEMWVESKSGQGRTFFVSLPWPVLLEHV